MKLGWIFVFAMLVILPTTVLSVEYVCDGQYKDGSKPTSEELKKILSDHKAWIESGKKRKKNDPRRANLCNANLSEAYLFKRNLQEANLNGADLNGVNLNWANLKKADLSGANLNGANLIKTLLYRAKLVNANLSGANLKEAKLVNANLSGANLNSAILIYGSMEDANLSGANLSKADLYRANLFKAKLVSANLSGANLRLANMYRADLGEAILKKANLSSAKLEMADLNGADLSEAKLERAYLKGAKLVSTDLSNADFRYVDLKDAQYEPTLSPNKGYLSGIKNLHSVRFKKGMHTELVLLRKNLKEVGLRELEREATYALEKGKTGHLSPSLEKYSRLVFFEWTAGYGLYPERCLIILLCLIPVFTLIYFFSVYRKKVLPPYNYLSEITSLVKVLPRTSILGQQRSGIYRIWSDDRVRSDLGSNEPELIIAGFVKSIGYALYFSILSAFHIGWRDVNIGNWIARIQPREYTLRSTGWVRTVSGIQSLISIYLLAFWVLTQFGRPFD